MRASERDPVTDDAMLAQMQARRGQVTGITGISANAGQDVLRNAALIADTTTQGRP